MPRTYHQKSFALFPASYSSISFSPLVYPEASVRHVRTLLRNHTYLQLQFNHYLTLYSTIDKVETLLDSLQKNWAEVFNLMTDESFIRLIQPFLIQQHR